MFSLSFLHPHWHYSHYPIVIDIPWLSPWCRRIIFCNRLSELSPRPELVVWYLKCELKVFYISIGLEASQFFLLHIIHSCKISDLPLRRRRGLLWRITAGLLLEVHHWIPAIAFPKMSLKSVVDFQRNPGNWKNRRLWMPLVLTGLFLDVICPRLITIVYILILKSLLCVQ